MRVQRSRLEHLEQVQLIGTLSSHPDPRLRLLYAIPNGGHRHIATARALKAEGVRTGVPDLHLPVPSGECAGLWIELKTEGGRLSTAQREYIPLLVEAGHAVLLAYQWTDALHVVLRYLEGKLELPEGHHRKTRWL